MLNKKTVKNILLEVEAACYNYEEYLQEIIYIFFNDNNNDIKYIITRDYNYNCLYLYKYSQNYYISWLYNNFDIDLSELSELKNNYNIIREYVQKNYIDYYLAEHITNFINISKFRKGLYSNKSLLQEVINDIYTNIEYNLNKELYKELIKIKREV